jgi:hypothetical protein
MSLKKELIKFTNKDTTQTFIFITLILVPLLVFDMLDMNSFVQLFGVTIIGFYTQKITDFKGFR